MINAVRRIAIRWLKSEVRRCWLLLRYVLLPKLLGRKARAEVYLALNDPYSYVLVQALPELMARYHVEFALYLVYENSPSMANPKLWREWSLKDAAHIAELYQLRIPAQMPDAESLATGQHLWQFEVKSIDDAIKIFEQTWKTGFERHYHLSTPIINFQLQNQARLERKGHYLPATIFFAGEWFWSLDRLAHFELRLQKLKMAIADTEVYYQRNSLQLPILSSESNVNQNKTLTAYLSIRSPYSYLGFVQAQRLASHYQLKLEIKPVIPMMMRGLTVAPAKQKYIFLDAIREAERHQIGFGKFADPIGQGIYNSYPLFPYMAQQGLLTDYVQALYQAVYVDGCDLAERANIRHICDKLGVDEQQALDYGQQCDWQHQMQVNQQALDDMGFWGVPCFQFRDLTCWGQDRLWQIERCLLAEQ